MAIITIFSGSFCEGESVCAKTAEKLGYDRIYEELLKFTSERFKVPQDKLISTMHGPLPFFNRFTREREKNTTYLQAGLAELIQRDNLLLEGFPVHLLPNYIPHILKVCLIANFNYRVDKAVSELGKSVKEAENMIHNDDRSRFEWTRFILEKSPYEDSLYDIVIPMHDTSVEEAVNLICEHANDEPVKTTARAKKAAEDFILTANVNMALVEAGHHVEVFTENGFVTLILNKYMVRLEQYKKTISEIASNVEGVLKVSTRIGPKYTPPPIIPMGDLDMPPKILLVDDEEEFIHTLSERLMTRNLESSIVYNGEQALNYVKEEEPEVMVLDLKMPGIDGLEVLRRVKRDHPNVEVIILTGHGSEREETLAKELGAFAYLHKPVDIDVLASTMKEAYKKILNLKKESDD